MKNIAAQISDFVGADSSIQIESDIDDLDKKLCEIVECIEECRNISENHNKLYAVQTATVNKTNDFINNVKEASFSEEKTFKNILNVFSKYFQDLKLQKSSEIDQLILLRSHLLNISSIENELKDLQSAPKMISDENSETTIVETLKSLQLLFKQTIHEYNKLSSHLVQSSDNAVIYKIWQDYLNHVKSFLRTDLPTDYHVLKEQLHLCQIHQNLISNQKNALIHKLSIDPVVPNEFEMFKNEHIEVLHDLNGRQGEIKLRIELWEKHRAQQIILLEMVDEIERDKSLLQLKQIHVKVVPKTKQQIESLVERIEVIQAESDKIKKDQPNVFNFVDDITASSIRLDSTATNQRISNIQAGLKTWLGYLDRIQELNNNYDFNVKTIKTNYQQKLGFLDSIKSEGAAGNSKQHLQTLRQKQVALGDLKADLENLNLLMEELKDYISVYDIKAIRQTIWILWQQYTDLNHEYSLLINQIEERLSLQSEFIIRYEQFMTWLSETESRLIESSPSYNQQVDDDAMRHYAKNILEDIALKEYDRKWIVSVGNELLLYHSQEKNYDSPEKIDIECKLENMNTKWTHIRLLFDNRTRKINEVKSTYYNLEARIAEIRTWLFETEKELLKPFIFEKPDKESFEKLLFDHEKVTRNTENKSSQIAEILNLSEMLLSELRSLDLEFNIKNLDLSIHNIEYRWKKLCETLVQRKKSLLALWNTLEELTKITNSNKGWLEDCDNLCNKMEANGSKLSRELCTRNVEELNECLSTIAVHTQVFQILEKLYNSLLTANIDIENIKSITADSRKLLITWKNITMKITRIRTVYEKYLEQFNCFENLHENIILNLTQIDVEITNIKHLKLYENTDEELDRIYKLKTDLDSSKKLIDQAEELKSQLQEKSSEHEWNKIQSMSEEHMKLYASLILSFDEISKAMGQEEVHEKHIGVQVNTLTVQSSVSAKDAYKYEIRAAIAECRANIDGFEKEVQDVQNNSDSTGVIPKSATNKVNKSIAACESTLELVKYLNTLLMKDYDCDDEEAHSEEVKELFAKFNTNFELWNTKKETKSLGLQ